MSQMLLVNSVLCDFLSYRNYPRFVLFSVWFSNMSPSSAFSEPVFILFTGTGEIHFIPKGLRDISY